MPPFVRFFRIVFCRFLAAFLLSASPAKDVQVRGHTRKDGTYVAPHVRSAPNKTKNVNYSTQGNVNPYTGQPGTKPRDVQPPDESAAKRKADESVARARFGQLTIGMSAAQVTAFVGEPQMVRDSTWTYRAGWVKFSANTTMNKSSVSVWSTLWSIHELPG